MSGDDTMAATLRGAGATRAVGRQLAGVLEPGDVVLLVGGLGAGKTTLVQGLVEGIGYGGEVTSPTFTLAQRYDGTLTIVHADLWRLDRTSELEELSFDEDLEDGAVLVAEWGEAAEARFGGEALLVRLAIAEGAAAESEREVVIEARGPSWRRRTNELRAALSRVASR